jgi:hypothetical protein
VLIEPGKINIVYFPQVFAVTIQVIVINDNFACLRPVYEIMEFCSYVFFSNVNNEANWLNLLLQLGLSCWWTLGKHLRPLFQLMLFTAEVATLGLFRSCQTPLKRESMGD